MGDQVLITSRRLKVTNPQRKRMIIPDVILHTKDVMIPVVKSVPFKQSFNIPLSENKLQILKVQNYRNNPALLFSETPLHTLYNPLENLNEVNHNIFPCFLKSVFFSLHIFSQFMRNIKNLAQNFNILNFKLETIYR